MGACCINWRSLCITTTYITNKRAFFKTTDSYFDNNSKDPELDVLRKGFADWLITDLSGVEGIQLVERDKLEQLVKETPEHHPDRRALTSRV